MDKVSSYLPRQWCLSRLLTISALITLSVDNFGDSQEAAPTKSQSSQVQVELPLHYGRLPFTEEEISSINVSQR